LIWNLDRLKKRVEKPHLPASFDHPQIGSNLSEIILKLLETVKSLVFLKRDDQTVWLLKVDSRDVQFFFCATDLNQVETLTKLLSFLVVNGAVFTQD
jgi:hypothetical protein